MISILKNVLDPTQLATAQQLLSQRKFLDGRVSAGKLAAQNKHNLEYVASPDNSDPVNNLVMGALIKHPVYLNAGLPHRIAAPYYSRYQKGMKYGTHVDDPIMGGREQYRSDLAITLFLNAPQQYEGGELEIETPYGSQRYKCSAGDAVMYPATMRHQVREVTDGERLVAVTWMQSLVKSPEQRALLYSLYQARQALLESNPDSPATNQVDDCYVNLVRMWSDL